MSSYSAMYLIPKKLFDNYLSKTNQQCTQVVKQINNVDVNGPGSVNISSSEDRSDGFSKESDGSNAEPSRDANITIQPDQDNHSMENSKSNPDPDPERTLDFSRIPISNQKESLSQSKFDPEDIRSYNKPDISLLDSSFDQDRLQSTLINEDPTGKEMIFVKDSQGVKIPKIVDKAKISTWNEPTGTDIFNAAIRRAKSDMKDNYYNKYNNSKEINDISSDSEEIEGDDKSDRDVDDYRSSTLISNRNHPIEKKTPNPLTVKFVPDDSVEKINMKRKNDDSIEKIGAKRKNVRGKKRKSKMSSIHYKKKPVREIIRGTNLDDSYTITDNQSRKRKPVNQLTKS